MLNVPWLLYGKIRIITLNYKFVVAGSRENVCVYYIFLFQITQKGYISSIALKLDKSQ